MSAPQRIEAWVCVLCGDWQRDPGPCRSVCGGRTKPFTYTLQAQAIANALRQAA